MEGSGRAKVWANCPYRGVPDEGVGAFAVRVRCSDDASASVAGVIHAVCDQRFQALDDVGIGHGHGLERSRMGSRT